MPGVSLTMDSTPTERKTVSRDDGAGSSSPDPSGPEEVIRALRYHSEDGDRYRAIIEGRSREVGFESSVSSCLYLARGIKKATGEEWPNCPLTQETLAYIAEKWPTNSWGQEREWIRENPRHQALTEAREARKVVKDAESLEEAVEMLENKPVSDGGGEETYRTLMLSEVTDPETVFRHPYPHLKERQKQQKEETKERVIGAFWDLYIEDGPLTSADIAEHGAVEVKERRVKQILEEADDITKEKYGRSHTNYYLPKGEGQ